MSEPMALHPIRFDDGDLYWDGDGAPAVAEVVVSIAAGIDVVVDAADTSTVLRWRVGQGADFRTFSDACAETDIRELLVHASSGIETSCAAVHLNSLWTRHALTAALTRWSVAPIDEGALMLDAATSLHRVGDIVGATRLFAIASPTLEMLAEGCKDGELSSSATDELAIAALAAADAVSETAWGHVLIGIAAQVQAVTAFNDDTLRRWIEELVDTASPRLVDTDMAGGVRTIRSTVSSGYVDPHAVPPRILAWRGAVTPELEATFRAGAESGRVTISVQLAPGVDPYAREAGEMSAYAADRKSGKLLSTAPMASNGHNLAGVLDVSEDAFADACFGVFHISTDPRDLRVGDPLGALVEVDRFMVESWTFRRAAVAARYVANSSSDSATHRAAMSAVRGFVRESLAAAESAAEILADLAIELGGGSAALSALLTRRIEAIERYLRVVESGNAVPDGGHPLLCELLDTRRESDDDLAGVKW